VLAEKENVEIQFFQIADTDSQRKVLSDVELSYHTYPHKLLFAGSYECVPKLKMWITLFLLALKSRADIVLIPGYDKIEYWAMLFGTILGGRRRAVFCDSTLYDRKQYEIKGALKRVFFSLCDGVFCYGKRSRDFLIHYGVSPDRIYVRRQAAALPVDYSVEATLLKRKEQYENSRSVHLIYVGRISEEKSLKVLIRSFAEIHRNSPGADLSLIGDGPQMNELKQLSKELCIEDVVFFRGSMNQDQLAHEFLRATCFVLPSKSEPWGLVVNEAMHYGCPVVVSSNCGCVPELVKEGITGYSFESENEAELTSKVLQLLNNLAFKESTSRECIEAIREFNAENSAAQILDGCQSILARN
jgi:glycosyltransferase involved in cell wall biosynthesis